MTYHNPNFPDSITTPGQDTRNVIDHYKGWNKEDVKDDLREKSFPVVLIVENFAHDFNISTAIRNANAFGVRKVVVLGRKSFDSRGTVGAQHYMDMEYTKDAEALYTGLKADGYQIVVADNIAGSVMLDDHKWEAKTAIVIGQEAIGVSNLTLSYADVVVEIEQFGSVRSINAGVASGIMLCDYARSVRT